MLFRLLCAAWLVWAAFVGAAMAQSRVALVIGNSNYEHATILKNPKNDALDMTAALEVLGFKVYGGFDLDYAAMGAKIGEFEDAARGADVTLLFYAGHGMQVNGRNYLIPVNARLERESALNFEAIDSDTVLNSMYGPGKTAIVFLDACRDNPLTRRFKRSLGTTRSTAVDQGLAAPNIADGGMLIGFSTSPGTVAADGDGRNSPFTTALLNHIATPGLEIQQMMTRVKADVYSVTKSDQVPWHNSSLRTEVYLGGETKAEGAPAPQPEQSAAPAGSSTAAEWELVKNTNSAAVLDAFIAAHPTASVYVALAEERKAALLKQAEPAPVEAPKRTAEEQQLALNDPPPPPAQAPTNDDLGRFFELGKAANEGNTNFALLSVQTVDLPVPARNPASKAKGLSLKKIASAPSLDALLQNNPDTAFSAEQASSCRLDWVDRCPHISREVYQRLADAMAAKGMDINDHNGNYYFLNRIAGSENYLLTNAPDFRDGTVAVMAAVVTPELEVLKLFGLDFYKGKLGVEAGAPESSIENTGAAMEGDDLYVSFDGGHRCTDVPRKFGLIAKISMRDLAVKWVSPFNVSDANLLLANGRLLSANGGSCVDDFLYEIDTGSGTVVGRAKLPSAIERMDQRDGKLTLELYDGAGVYQLP
jgi:uncharacterized caspase-like protein